MRSRFFLQLFLTKRCAVNSGTYDINQSVNCLLMAGNSTPKVKHLFRHQIQTYKGIYMCAQFQILITSTSAIKSNKRLCV